MKNKKLNLWINFENNDFFNEKAGNFVQDFNLILGIFFKSPVTLTEVYLIIDAWWN